MTDTDRLNQYFHLRASTISVEAPEPAVIASRAHRRRRSRRTAGAVAAAIVVLVGALAVFGGGSGTRELSVAGSTAARSALEWTRVDVPDGLGWSAAAVASDDGSVYGLSTAPGPNNDPSTPAEPSLYRSADGRSWEQRALPRGLSASALATSDGHLYAVGTAPGGGGIDLVVASSSDGAGSWSEARIPAPAAELRTAHPNEVRLSAPEITTGPNGLVAAVTVTAVPDVAARLGRSPDELSAGWETTADGVNLFAPLDPADACSGAEPSTTTTAPATLAPEDLKQLCARDAKARTIVATYTWDQLGLEPELKAMLGGQVHLYRSTDGTSFDEVGADGIPTGYAAGLMGADDGYRLLVADSATSALHPLWSLDGRTWTATGPDLDGYVQSLGLLAGRPAAVVGTKSGATLLTATGGGGWSATELPSTGTPATANQPAVGGIFDSALGPLGLVAVAAGDGSGADTTIVDSADGHDFTTHDLADLAGPGNWSVAGITMDADAVIVRLLPAASDKSDKSGSAPGPQRLLIGTPR